MLKMTSVSFIRVRDRRPVSGRPRSEIPATPRPRSRRECPLGLSLSHHERRCGPRRDALPRQIRSSAQGKRQEGGRDGHTKPAGAPLHAEGRRPPGHLGQRRPASGQTRGDRAGRTRPVRAHRRGRLRRRAGHRATAGLAGDALPDQRSDASRPGRRDPFDDRPGTAARPLAADRPGLGSLARVRRRDLRRRPDHHGPDRNATVDRHLHRRALDRRRVPAEVDRRLRARDPGPEVLAATSWLGAGRSRRPRTPAPARRGAGPPSLGVPRVTRAGTGPNVLLRSSRRRHPTPPPRGR